MPRASLALPAIALATLIVGCPQQTASSAAFVDDVAQWLALGDDDAMAKQAPAVAARWQGKSVRWEALASAGLCIVAERTCALSPFPRNDPRTAGKTADAPNRAELLGGLLARARFNEAAWAALKAQCAGQTDCLFTLDATVSAVVISVDDPLAVTLDVSAVSDGHAPVDADRARFARRAPVVEQRATLTPPPSLPNGDIKALADKLHRPTF